MSLNPLGRVLTSLKLTRFGGGCTGEAAHDGAARERPREHAHRHPRPHPRLHSLRRLTSSSSSPTSKESTHSSAGPIAVSSVCARRRALGA
eukprot:3014948-Rhodomonas_salina.4